MADFDPKRIKAAFFDADGTLISLSTGQMPESCRRALVALKEAGIMPILSTGRPKYQFRTLDPSYFEAFITLNGQYVYTKEKLLYKAPMERDVVDLVLSQVKEGKYSALFQLENDCFCTGHDQMMKDFEKLAGAHFVEDDIERALNEDVYQINALLWPGEEKIISDATQSVRITRWSDLFVDVMPAGGGKAQGIKKIMAEFGFSRDECICFGDGENDVDMFAEVGFACAMGNAYDSVKSAADFVCEHVDNDGIWRACMDLALI